MYNEENERAISYLQDLAGIEIDEDGFCNEIYLFSRYLTLINPSYKYNETYLNSFCKEFFEFKKYITIKNCIFDMIKNEIWGCSYDITLTLDNLWKYDYYYNNGKPIYKYGKIDKIDKKILFSEQICVKCIIKQEKSEFIFRKNASILKDKKILEEPVQQLLHQLDNFINDINVTEDKNSEKERAI